MVTFKFEYNAVEIKSFNANMIKLGQTFPDMLSNLYSSHRFKNTPIVASSCKHGNTNSI